MKVTIQDTRHLGQRPSSAAMKVHLASIVPKRDESETIIVHHYADKKDGLMLVLERNSSLFGLKFQNLVL